MRNLVVRHYGSLSADAFGTVTLLLVAILTAALGAAILAAAILPDGAFGTSGLDKALHDIGVFTPQVLSLLTA